MNSPRPIRQTAVKSTPVYVTLPSLPVGLLGRKGHCQECTSSCEISPILARIPAVVAMKWTLGNLPPDIARPASALAAQGPLLRLPPCPREHYRYQRSRKTVAAALVAVPRTLSESPTIRRKIARATPLTSSGLHRPDTRRSQHSVSIRKLAQSPRAATQPIEISKPFGSGTCMVIRAGGFSGKNSAKRRLSSGKLDTSAMSTVVLTTRLSWLPLP